VCGQEKSEGKSGSRNSRVSTHLLKLQLKVMDSTALSMGMDNQMLIIILNVQTEHNRQRVVSGKKVGKFVS
jgi:uridylate kinase